MSTFLEQELFVADVTDSAILDWDLMPQSELIIIYPKKQ